MSFEAESGTLYKINWPPIRGAFSYRLYLNGVLIQDKLTIPPHFFDIADLNREVHRLAYEGIDATGKSLGKFEQSVDVSRLFPAVKTEFITITSSTNGIIDLEWPTASKAVHYQLFLNGQMVQKNLTQPEASLVLNELTSKIETLAYEALDQSGHSLGKFVQTLEKPIEIADSRIWPKIERPIRSYSPVASPTPNLSPVLELTEDPWVIERSGTRIAKVFDDLGQPLDDVRIQIRSLNEKVLYRTVLKTVNGVYSFKNVPTGVQLEFIAEKSGYTTRKKVEVISSHDHYTKVKYNFGAESPSQQNFDSPFYYDSPFYSGLSDKPEVTLVTPARNGSGVSPTTDFTLLFSEPMDRQSVEDNFTIRSFNSRLLTVDGGPLPPGLIDLPIPHTVKGNGSSSSNFLTGNSTPIYDSSAFDVTWNADDTQVTFSFKPGKALPTDKDTKSIPDYNIAFKSFKAENRTIKDKSGIERKEKHFKLTDGDFEESYKFSILPDLIPPNLESTQWTGVTPQASLLLQFSEPMLLKTHSLNIAGGMKDTPVSCKQAPAGYPTAKLCTAQKAAENYSVKVSNSEGKTLFQGAWADLGGEANYGTWDPSYKTVILSTKVHHPAFVRGAKVEITPSHELIDPAGNPLAANSPTLTIELP